MRVSEVPFAAIEVGDRARVDYGDINELKNSILRNGLIHPLVVATRPDGRYDLLAGGRRHRAISSLEWTEVPVRLYEELTELEKLEIELEENLRRKELHYSEEVALKARIDEVKRALYGSKQQGSNTDAAEGKWGIKETASELHETPGNVSRDLQLARAIKVLPELATEEGKVMAFRKLKRLEKLIIRELLARQTMRLPSGDLPFEIKRGSALEVLRTLPDESVQCVVTSPPYWAQRDYGVPGQLGLEPTPEQYVSDLADIFNEVMRVLKRDGVVWVNLDDTYFDENKGGAPTGFVYDTAYGTSVKMDSLKLTSSANIKKKDLVGIPWMFAFEMRRRGWWLRSSIVWSKSSSTPEGTTDRPVNTHESIFMFAKSDIYSFNNQDWLSSDPMKRRLRSVWQIDLSPTGDSAHIASYPIELPRTCLLASSQPGDTVLDPFSGSGTTGEAALMEDREYIGIELNPDDAEASEQRLRAAFAERVDREEAGDEDDAAAESVVL